MNMNHIITPEAKKEDEHKLHLICFLIRKNRHLLVRIEVWFNKLLRIAQKIVEICFPPNYAAQEL